MSTHPLFSGSQGNARDVTAQASVHLRKLMGKMLAYCVTRESDSIKQICSHIYDLLDDMRNQERSQNLRSACVLLDKHSEAFARAFQDTLQAGLEAQVREALSPKKNDTDAMDDASTTIPGMTLSLVDLGDMDRLLLVDRVAQRFNAKYDAVLSPLTQRLGALLGSDSIGLADNPFRPEIFIRAFLEAWEACKLDEHATLDLLQSLDPAHCMNLAPLYTDMDVMLADAGVPAQAAYRIRRSVGGPSSHMGLGPSSGHAPLTDTSGAPLSGHASGYPSGHSGMGGMNSRPAALSGGSGSGAGSSGSSVGSGSRSAWGNLAPMGRNMAVQAKQFLQRLGFGAQSGEGSEGGGEGHYAPHEQVAADSEFMGYLGGLQAGTGGPSQYNNLGEGDLQQHNVLRQMRDREEVRRAPELDRGTVDALAEIFDFVFADQAIPLQMKFVIGRLQIPVLKAAMIDRDFFFSNEHPARRLVDTLASASVAWVPEKGETDPLYLQIQQTVQRVLTEFEDDIEIFADLLREFTEFLFENEQQVQGRIEPVVVKERSGESYSQALSHVDEVIHARIKALPPELPLVPFLVPFLTTQWREVMARAWMNQDFDAKQWEEALAAMDQLIWSTQPKTNADERRQLVAVLPTLVRKLNASLDEIDCFGEVRETFTRRLIATHMMAIRMTQPATVDAAVVAQEVQVGKQAMTELDQRRAEKRIDAVDTFDDEVKTFTRGMWFEFTQESAQTHRCLLSWVSPMRTRLLFTNREGFDAFVRSEREVAALLRRGLLKAMDQQPIVGRAIGRIMAEVELEMAA